MTTTIPKPSSFYREVLSLFDDAKAKFADMVRLTCESRILAEQSRDAANLAAAIAVIDKSESHRPFFCVFNGELKVYCTRSSRWLRWRTWVKKHIPEYAVGF